MSDQNEAQTAGLVGLTADIVSAYVSQNPLPVGGLPDLIASIHSSLTGLVQPNVAELPKQEPATNPKRSVTPDYIICLEDGKKFKSLKRHLAVASATARPSRGLSASKRLAVLRLARSAATN
ncbi:MucR family transcriptional regulator, partial [Mesorhizobium sp. ES1-3]|uniref:MucR family transcriptional regulator n=1 Tax=Mesorhizobium sp. ES1-3 TaxID=2876628 RepID=UPI001CC9D399